MLCPIRAKWESHCKNLTWLLEEVFQIISLGPYMQNQFGEVWRAVTVFYYCKSFCVLVEMQCTTDVRGKLLNLDVQRVP